MSQSKSSPTNTTANTSQVTTTNDNVSGNSGVTLAPQGNGNTTALTINTTSVDPSVVSSALSASTTAFGNAADVAAASISSNQQIDQASIDQSTGISKASLLLAGNALQSASDTNANALDTINTLASGFATQLEGVVTSEQAALQQDQASSQTQLGNVVSALSSSYVAGSTSVNQSIIDEQTTVIKYLAIAAALVGVVYFYRKAA